MTSVMFNVRTLGNRILKTPVTAYKKSTFDFWKGRVCVVYQSSSSGSPPQNPLQRTWKTIKADLTKGVQRINDPFKDYHPDSNLFPEHCDILIVGGGIMGSSIAYWLKQRALDGLRVVVLERDTTVKTDNFNSLEYRMASTVLSCGGIRQQFSLPENIRLSLFGAEFVRNIKQYLTVEGEDPPEVLFTPGGYLFLASEKGGDILLNNAKVQKENGAKNEILTPAKLKSKFPWLNTDGIVLGCHGLENEGWIDPWSLLNAFKKKAISLGTEYVVGETDSFDFEVLPDTSVEGQPGEYYQPYRLNVKTADGQVRSIRFAILIIAAGAYSGEVAKLAGIGNGKGYLAAPVPVEPRKRYVYSIHTPDSPGLITPVTIDPSGTYFRRDGLCGNYICGLSPNSDEEPIADNLDVDHDYFDQVVWPILANRVPAFEAVKVKSAWAGYYDYNYFDENGIIGPHPGYINTYLATGFSGHGLQQAAAVGRAMMELIIEGHYETLDLTRMHIERLYHQERLLETNIV